MSHSYTIQQKNLPSGAPAPAAGDVMVLQPPGMQPRLLLAARYGQLGASSRLRLAQYQPWLERAGIRTSLRAFLSDRYIAALYNGGSRIGPVLTAYLRAFRAGQAARAHDIIWVEKEYLPWLPFWLERLALGGTPYILDFDDAWALRYEQAGSALVRRIFGGKFARLLRGAALTVTANQTLYDWACAAGARRVLLLPTVVDPGHYVPVPEPAGPFTIGWVGTPLTAAYLQVIAEPLRRLSAEAPLKLLIIGAPDACISGVACEHAAWDESTEAGLIGRCHAGIMPLPDDEWSRGKSGYKIIQYMAMARPAVASPIGANRQIIRQNETGFLAAGADEWLDALRRLRDDPALRAAMGAAARLRVETQFSLQVTAPVLIEAIQEILAGEI